MTKDPMAALQTAVDVAQMKVPSESLAEKLSPLSSMPHKQGDGERMILHALNKIDPVRVAEGAFFELNRVLYEVTRVSKSGKLLCKPFTGQLLVPRGTATATQIQGAKKA